MEKEENLRKTDQSEDGGGIISNNLGKIFGGVLLSIVLYFVRLTKNRDKKDALIAQVEESFGVEPYEIEDLRNANTYLTAHKFKAVAKKVLELYPVQASYRDFIVLVSKELSQNLQHGYLLDRVVAKYYQNHPEQEMDAPLPTTFLLAVLSLAMYSDVEERIDVFYSFLARDLDNGVELDAAADFISALQDTCQIPPERNVREAAEKYPIQKFRQISGSRMLEESLENLKAKEKHHLSLDDFTQILKGQAVCAWGECYHKKTKA